MLKFIIPHIFTLIPKEWKGVVGEYITRKKPTQHFVEPAFILSLKRRLPTLPLLRSTIGVTRLNFSVRNGKRWIPRAITTLSSFLSIF